MLQPRSWIFDDSAGAYLDKTFESGYTVLEDTADRWYLGFERRFSGLNFVLSRGGDYGDLKLEYWDGTDWIGFGLPYALEQTELVTWNIRASILDWSRLAFTDGIPHSIDPPDSKERYWFRLSCTTVTTAATISSLSVVPYVQYTTAQAVSDFLQQATGEGFDLTTRPTEHTVEDTIRRHESSLEKITRKSWRLEERTEYHEFNYGGIRVVKPPMRELKRVRLWQGADWRNLLIGRTGECYSIEEQSMVFFTRFFVPIFVPYSGGGAVLPFVYLYMMRYPVEITYQRGFSFEDHEEAGLAEQTVILMTAVSLMQQFEQSILSKRGVDSIEMSSRVRFWREEIEDNLKSLATGFTVF